MSDRKIIQVVPMVVPGMDNMTRPEVSILALCDDGTLWMGDGTGYWLQVSGPEHLPKLDTARQVRQNLKEALDEETYETVRGLLRSGGAL